MRKLILPLFFAAAFLASAGFLIAQMGDAAAQAGDVWAQAYDGSGAESPAAAVLPPPVRWYRSNAAGMALERIPSRLVALRSQYSLSVETVPPAEIPEILLPYHDSAYHVELRTLFREAQAFRRQWIFRDSRGIAALVSSGSACFFGGEPSEDEPYAGFIEFRNPEGAIVRERLFQEDFSQWEFRFSFEGNILRSSEAWFKEAPAEFGDTIPAFALLHTDFYRYSRAGSLRAIDRVFHEGTGQDRVFFPRPGLAAAFDRETGEMGTVAVFYTPQFILNAISVQYGARVSYSLDVRGRLLSE
ncbi:MAG: hypothetical protein FWC65_03675, partial [Treponema sp.]|nr:hypothetical protein [Treponema sp.]